MHYRQADQMHCCCYSLFILTSNSFHYFSYLILGCEADTMIVIVLSNNLRDWTRPNTREPSILYSQLDSPMNTDKLFKTTKLTLQQRRKQDTFALVYELRL